MPLLQGRLTDHYDLLLDNEMAFKFTSMKLAEKYGKMGILIELKLLHYDSFKKILIEKETQEQQNKDAATKIFHELNHESFNMT